MMLSLRTSPLAVSPFRSGPSFATPRRLLSASSSSSSSFTGGQPRSFPSKLHPGLYYHQNHPHLDPAHQGTTTLVSYLPTPPPSLKFSPTTIGTLRPLKNPSPGPSRVFSVELGRGGDVALTSESALDGPEADEGVPPISPRTLTENPDFLRSAQRRPMQPRQLLTPERGAPRKRLVHEVISMNLADDAWLQTQAKSVHADTHMSVLIALTFSCPTRLSHLKLTLTRARGAAISRTNANRPTRTESPTLKTFSGPSSSKTRTSHPIRTSRTTSRTDS